MSKNPRHSRYVFVIQNGDDGTFASTGCLYLFPPGVFEKYHRLGFDVHSPVQAGSPPLEGQGVDCGSRDEQAKKPGASVPGRHHRNRGNNSLRVMLVHGPIESVTNQYGASVLELHRAALQTKGPRTYLMVGPCVSCVLACVLWPCKLLPRQEALRKCRAKDTFLS